jgi:hypothetical protein
MRSSKFRSGAHPTGTDNEEYLRQNEIEKSERFSERFAPGFYLFLSALELSFHRSNVEWLKRWIVEAISCCHGEEKRTIADCDGDAVEGNSQRFFASLRMTTAFGF